MVFMFDWYATMSTNEAPRGERRKRSYRPKWEIESGGDKATAFVESDRREFVDGELRG
jgi:hypothetical protein